MKPSYIVLAAMFAASSLDACSGGSSGASTPTPVSTLPPPPPPPPAVGSPESEADVVYGSGLTNGGAKTLLMDIYQTGETCDTLRPLVLIIHGGAFARGSKTSSGWDDRARDAVGRGYVAASINYRLIGDNPVVSTEFDSLRRDLIATNVNPDWDGNSVQVFANAVAAAVEDGVTALRYLRDNSPEDRCIDMSKVAIWGGSAGSITAMHIGYGLDEYSIDFPTPSVIINYWGMVFQDGLMKANDAPLFILHGGDDDIVDIQEAIDLKSEADAVGVGAALYTVAGAGHGYSGINISTPLVNGKSLRTLTLDFLDAHLGDGTAVYETVTIK